ncbi:hypothetical protein KKB69_01260 [Patescibacteria group bacterium]|nr:hypothetical protein [Patescibacteria group bacterium]
MQKTKQILATLAIIISLFLVNQAIMAWTTPTGAPPSSNAATPINTSATAQTKSGTLISSTDMRAPIFYDQNNTGYYVSPDSNSWLYRLYSYDIRSSIFYDLDNTGYYVDPASTSKFNTINLGGVNRNSWPSATINYGDCVILEHSEGGPNCDGDSNYGAWGMCPTNYVMVGATTGLRFPNACVEAQVKCCRLQ